MGEAETIKIPDDDKFSTVEINFEEPITKSEALSFWHRVCDLPKIEQQRDDLLAACKAAKNRLEQLEKDGGDSGEVESGESTLEFIEAAIAKSEVQAYIENK